SRDGSWPCSCALQAAPRASVIVKIAALADTLPSFFRSMVSSREWLSRLLNAHGKPQPGLQEALQEIEKTALGGAARQLMRRRVRTVGFLRHPYARVSRHPLRSNCVVVVGAQHTAPLRKQEASDSAQDRGVHGGRYSAGLG